MNAEKTAIARKTASVPTRTLLKDGAIWGRVLDYGCGRGMDTQYLLKEGFEVLSYDPHYEPTDLRSAGKFDTILCNYVLNVIEDEKARVQLIKTLINYLTIGGKLFITARPEKDITTAATKGTWATHKDGFITGSKTFQKGISDEYINDLYTMAKTILPTVKLDFYTSSSKYTIIAIQRLKYSPKS